MQKDNSPRQVGRQTRGPDSAYMTSCERCQREREREERVDKGIGMGVNVNVNVDLI